MDTVKKIIGKRTEEEYLQWRKEFLAEIEKNKHLSSLRMPTEWWMFVMFMENYSPSHTIELLFQD